MALNISLNGSNYVSDKTRGAFEQALGEARGQRPETRFEKPEARIENGATNTPHPITHDSQLLETLDRALAQSYEHQTMTMRIHEQYLHNQSDYARIFSELMQQQGAIFANGDAVPQQAHIAATVLETLARSMARFHDLQEQTLDVHKQFLAQQSDYARAAIQLLAKQQVSEPTSQRASESAEWENGNGHHPQEAESKMQEARIENPQPSVPSPQSPVPAPQSLPPQPTTRNPQPSSLVPSLLAIVSEKTGYPTDMLELDMDMEADLGIDSIKRVEILGALQDAHPELPEVSTDILAEMRTLRQIVDKMQETGDKTQETRVQQPKKA